MWLMHCGILGLGDYFYLESQYASGLSVFSTESTLTFRG
jgi:hypothetical protein